MVDLPGLKLGTPGHTGFLGSFNNPTTPVAGYITDSTTPAATLDFKVYTEVTATGLSTLQGTVTVTAFVTSCKEYTASLLRVDRAVLEVPALLGSPFTVHVYAVAGPSETLSVFVTGTSGLNQACALTATGAAGPTLPAPATFSSAAQPTAYLASCTFAAAGILADPVATAGVNITVHSSFGPTAAFALAKAAIVGTAMFDGQTLTVCTPLCFQSLTEWQLSRACMRIRCSLAAC